MPGRECDPGACRRQRQSGRAGARHRASGFILARPRLARPLSRLGAAGWAPPMCPEPRYPVALAGNRATALSSLHHQASAGERERIVDGPRSRGSAGGVADGILTAKPRRPSVPCTADLSERRVERLAERCVRLDSHLIGDTVGLSDERAVS